MNENMAFLCDQTTIDQVARLMQESEPEALDALADAMANHPHDARLLLMRGSIYASQGRSSEAHTDLSRAIILDPSLSTARFLLGYLELISGKAGDAVAIWQPLAAYSPDTVLGLFAGGMVDLVQGRAESALELFTRGLQGESQATALTPFIQSMIPKIESILAENGQADRSNLEVDAGHFLLADYLANRTQH
jgi:tetratricopeptide (TPR) repeat protein